MLREIKLILILFLSTIMACDRDKPETRYFNNYVIEIEAIDNSSAPIIVEPGTPDTAARMEIRTETSSLERTLKATGNVISDDSGYAFSDDGIFRVVFPEEVERKHIKTLYL